jgi:hypothetical protein
VIDLGVDIALREHWIGELQRQAVDQDGITVRTLHQHRREIARHLDHAPIGAAPRAMRDDARSHFALERLGNSAQAQGDGRGDQGLPPLGAGAAEMKVICLPVIADK